jgi:hypothetical protein
MVTCRGGDCGADPVLPGIDGARLGGQPDRRVLPGVREGSDPHGLTCPVDAGDADADAGCRLRLPAAGESRRSETGRAESGGGESGGDEEGSGTEAGHAQSDVHVSVLG